jgi:hypothetical protein
MAVCDQLAAATDHAVVAFQADDLDPVLRSGWSVTVVGRSEEVTDGADIARLGEVGLESWHPVPATTSSASCPQSSPVGGCAGPERHMADEQHRRQR